MAPDADVEAEQAEQLGPGKQGAGAARAAVFAGEDVESAPGRDAEVATIDVPPTDMSVVRSVPTTVATGVNDAARVVAFGRGVQAKGDMALIERLAAALGAEVACSMPIADDLHWMDKARYIGRSGQHIAPALYLAIGIAGAPQHMEGVREARVVVAINNDPGAPVFRLADYGIVGDLYDVVPALIEALDHQHLPGGSHE